MEYTFINVQKTEHKLFVTLARSEKRNAFTPTMVNEIYHVFQQANTDDEVKLIVIKAEGPVFCAGMDLKTFENPELAKTNPLVGNQNISLGEVFDKLLKPSIAIVEGNVIAGGFLIVLGCSYVFCRRDIQFKLPELEIGLFPFQVMASLLKVMPEKKVLQLCLQTDYFDAEKAKEYGIVDGFLEDTNLETFMSSFANKSTHAMKQGIQALRQLPNVSYSDRYKYLKEVLDNLKNKD